MPGLLPILSFILAGLGVLFAQTFTTPSLVTQVGQTIDRCHSQCAPLLRSVKPLSEARRVYSNCRAGCDPPKTHKPDKTPVPKPKPKPNGKLICTWSGTAPFCEGKCRGPGLFVKDISKTGNGSKCFSGYKVLCCQRVVGG